MAQNMPEQPLEFKGDVKRITSDGSVEFDDGSRKNFSIIIYATGNRRVKHVHLVLSDFSVNDEQL